jgi:hypothetical protein
MKKTIIVIACASLFVACKKPNPTVHCWQCTNTDSLSSSIPALADPHYGMSGEKICNYTGDMINAWLKRNKKADTIYNKHDTLVVKNWTPSCEQLD